VIAVAIAQLVHLILVEADEEGIQSVDEPADGHPAGKVLDPSAIPSHNALQLAIQNSQICIDGSSGVG